MEKGFGVDKWLQQIKNIEEFSIIDLDREGIYLLYDANDELIYIGETSNIIRRIFCNHRNGNKNNSTLIRRLLRGDLEIKKYFEDEKAVKNFIKSLSIKVLIDDALKDENYRKRLEQKLKEKLLPKL